jgi:hypothetical protein
LGITKQYGKVKKNMKQKIRILNKQAEGSLRGLRTDTDGAIGIITIIMAIIVLCVFVFFVMNIVNIALGLALIGISLILIGAGINVIRNALTGRKKSGDYRQWLRSR